MTSESRSGQVDTPAPAETSRDDAAAGTPVPYPPSVVDSFMTWAEPRPVTTLALFVAMFVVLAVAANVVTWIGEPADIGSFDVYRTSLPFYIVFPLALMPYLNRVARRALATFRPALGAHSERFAVLEYELTVLPPGPTWAVLLGSLLFTAAFAAYTPSLTEAITDAPWVAAFDVALYVLIFAVLGVFLYHTFHQLRTVSRIHRDATNVNLFKRAPLYAFSWLTARTAMGLSAQRWAC